MLAGMHESNLPGQERSGDKKFWKLQNIFSLGGDQFRYGSGLPDGIFSIQKYQFG
jgi:hypothetical protein